MASTGTRRFGFTAWNYSVIAPTLAIMRSAVMPASPSATSGTNEHAPGEYQSFTVGVVFSVMFFLVPRIMYLDRQVLNNEFVLLSFLIRMLSR